MSSSVEDDEADLTRKQRREQAREERKAVEEAHASGAARRKRLTLLGSAIAGVVVIVVVILIATGGSSGGGNNPAPPGQAVPSKNIAAVEATVGGIPQHGNVLGNPNAPVTIQYFGDLECPICRDFTLGAFSPIVQKWVKTGKVKIEYRSLETASREPEVFKDQQVAALAAGKQNKMWQYVDLFYHEQGEEDSGYVNNAYLQKLAQGVPGLNLSTWSTDRNDGALNNQVEADAQAANNAGFTGTPSFLIAKTGGTPAKLNYTSLTDPTAFNEAIEKTLKEG